MSGKLVRLLLCLLTLTPQGVCLCRWETMLRNGTAFLFPPRIEAKQPEQQDSAPRRCHCYHCKSVRLKASTKPDTTVRQSQAETPQPAHAPTCPATPLFLLAVDSVSHPLGWSSLSVPLSQLVPASPGEVAATLPAEPAGIDFSPPLYLLDCSLRC